MRMLALSYLLALATTFPAVAQNPKKAGQVKLTDAKVKSEKHVYSRPAEGELYLHVFYPTDWKASDKRPVIVFFFGGGWKNGAYTQFVPQAEYFASRGLVTACADYRIASKHKTTPDRCVSDAKAAVRWVRSKAEKLGIDPGKVIGAGGSAGGHLAAAAALLPGFDAASDAKVSCKPDALVLFNPALNLVGFAKVRDVEEKDITRDFSPTLFLHKDAPPTLLLFGTSDRMMPQAKEYLTKARDLGVKCELHLAADQPHGFFNRPPWLHATTRKADEFLVALGYLKGEPTIAVPDKAGLERAQPASR
jgi:acetyl esterase